MKFVDRIVVKIIAGKGGNGVVAWRREKFIPKGGPTGGNGGNGGSVIFEASDQLSSLENFRNRSILKAENGICGGANSQTGRGGKNLKLTIPVGTLIKNSKTGEVLFDCTEKGQRFQVCKGGIGGRGNESFKTPTNRAPNTWTPGTPGEELSVELELKLIADVGLVGFPNAGKSTLIQQLAHIRVKVGAYPFTTLHPHLGHLHYPDGSRLLVADIPGIIKGAHANKGLGIEFLRHIERTHLLIYMLDASGIDGRTPTQDYLVLREELAQYNPDLLVRPSLIVLNKTETEESVPLIEEFQREYADTSPFPIFYISAKEGTGLETLIEAIQEAGFPYRKAPTRRLRSVASVGADTVIDEDLDANETHESDDFAATTPESE